MLDTLQVQTERTVPWMGLANSLASSSTFPFYVRALITSATEIEKEVVTSPDVCK